MSKIIREEIVAPIRMVSAGVMSTLAAVNKIENAINQREAEFAELVEAVKAQYGDLLTGIKEIIDSMPTNDNSINGCKLRELYKPFLPSPSPADRLDALIEIGEVLSTTDTIMVSKTELLGIIAELREGEG